MKKILIVIGLILCITSICAQSSFIIKRIEVQGLQRVSRSTVLSYLPIRAGESYVAADSEKIIESLFKTGFFSKISLYRHNQVLLIRVDERPVIGAIRISGNKQIATNDLLKVLNKARLTAGQVFDHATLINLKQSLLQTYYNLGRYSARVDVKVTPQPRKRVLIVINIYEGPIAKIKKISIKGNRHFSERQLLKNFSLAPTRIWSLLTRSDQYSKLKLDTDLEKLRGFYLDHGYLQFKVNATKVNMSPDKKHVYIIIYISEGPVYRIGGISLNGNLLGQRQQIQELIDIKTGDIFSRQKIIDVTTQINRFLGDRGYAAASVNPVPRLDNVKHLIFITFMVTPGKRIYIRRISFTGNSKTADYVLRREMRQMEGALYSLSNINESKHRLNMLGYLKNIQSRLNPVPGYNNQNDLQFHVTEASATTASLNVGYSDVEKFLYGASINDQNFLGTGKAVGLQFNHSAYSKDYGFNYFNPYHTINNVSMGINLYASFVTPGDVGLSEYKSKVFGGAVTYGFPISERTRFNFGYGYEHTNINTTSDTPKQIINFINKYKQHIFDAIKLTGGWEYNNLDRAVFPTRGTAESLGIEAAVPFTKHRLQYYKINYDTVWYHPLTKRFIFEAHAYIGYGNGYGKFKELPFFENYYAGGIGSVRGFEPNSLGPKDSNGDAIGGNVSINGTLALIFPNPLGDRLRTSAFIDAGGVTKNQISLRKMDASVGVQMELHFILPLVVSVAVPIYKGKYDKGNAAVVNFSFGGSFF